MYTVGGSVNVYTDQSLCFHLGMIGANGQCFNPEGFASFIGLLESIPFHDPGPDYQLFEHSPPVLRCINFLIFYLFIYYFFFVKEK